MSVYKLKIAPEKKKSLEDLCRHCGHCCVLKEKMADGKMVFHPDKPCPHLKKKEDDGSGQAFFCDIYDNRLNTEFEIDGHEHIRCLNTKDSFREGGLPEDCPYYFYFASRAATVFSGKETIAKWQRKALEILNHACGTQDWSRIVSGPKPNCKHCFGRGYEGKNAKTGDYVPCRCLNRESFF